MNDGKVVEVRSAVPLTVKEKATLKQKLAKRFSDDLEFRFRIDESLIGGVRVKIGDQVIDGSVAGKLEALREQLVGR
ncbi:MAG: ATP synthase F1 subunit delta [Anaerolineae bacterium]